MKTEVVMSRQLFGRQVRQSSQTGFFCATDIVAAGNAHRLSRGLGEFVLSQWLNYDSTKEFVGAVRAKDGGDPVFVKRGRNGGTWVHPLVFIDIALAISPDLKVEAYAWLYDELIKNRNESGDSYKRMCGGLYERFSNKREFPNFVANTAGLIRLSCDAADWQSATEEQLRLRNTIHNNIALFTSVLQDPHECVRLGIREAKSTLQKS